MQSKSSSCAWLLIGGILLVAVVAIPVVLSVVFGLLYQQAHTDLEQCRQSSTTASHLSTAVSQTSAITVGTSTTTAASSTEEPVENPTLRLPTNVIPLHYQLTLQVFLPFNQTEEGDQADTFRILGTVHITVKPLQDGVDRITLHARTRAPPGSGQLSFSQSQVQLLRGTNRIVIDRVEFQPESDIFVVLLKETLRNNTEYMLSITDYRGVIANDTEGLYRSSYIRDGVRQWLAVAKFQPHKARRMLPCFDEPGFRSTFNVTVKHDSRFTTVRSNGLASEPHLIGGGWAETRFNTTPSMPVYLLTILVSTFGQRTTYTLNNTDNPVSRI